MGIEERREGAIVKAHMNTSAKSKFLLFASILPFALSGCSNRGGPTVDVKDAPAFIEGEYVDFSEGDTRVFDVSDDYSNGNPFGCVWTRRNAVYTNDCFELSITKEEDTFYGGEQRSRGEEGRFLYGYFGCYMKPAKVAGTVSTFFTYTGPYENCPHDEIDIEFLGKDTTSVQFNYFANGSHGNEYIYELGFDASEEYHQYGFYWGKNEIVWYVDLKPVYKATKGIPNTPGRIFQNCWCGDPTNGSIIGWMGSLEEDKLPAIAQYQKLTYADIDGRNVAERELPPPLPLDSASDLK